MYVARKVKKIRVFDVIRKQDESGVSGVGKVIEGVEFSDGTVVIRWITKMASTAIYPNYETFYKIHIESHPQNESVVNIGEV